MLPMARVTKASTPQSAWLEELADVDCDWDSISLPSTPIRGASALSSSTEDAASLPHVFVKAESPSESLSSTEGDPFGDTADLEDFLCRIEGSDFSSTTEPSALISTSAVSSSHPSSSSRPSPCPSAASAFTTPKRIIRKGYPEALKSNSPIPGLTPSLRLRTSFCLGEALNIGCQASRQEQNILLELYCRVMSSHREDATQHFVLADLTHDNPPFISATFASWKGVPLFDDDARVFLDGKGKDHDGKMCRCLGTMMRVGSKWIFVLVSIWQADLDDVEYVAAIVT